MGLVVKYSTSEIFRRFLQNILSLPYIPCKDMLIVYEEILENNKKLDFEGKDDFLAYFEGTYLGSGVINGV